MTNGVTNELKSTMMKNRAAGLTTGGAFILSVILASLHGAGICCAATSPEPINPYPREIISEAPAASWDFEHGSLAGWRAVNETRLDARNSKLWIAATGHDPYIHVPKVEAEGPVMIELRMKSSGVGEGEIFWTTKSANSWSPDRSARFEIDHDGGWHDVTVELPVEGVLTQWRLDPGTGAGEIVIDQAIVKEYRRHPIELASISVQDDKIQVLVRNHSESSRNVSWGGNTWQVPAGGQTEVHKKMAPEAPFGRVIVSLAVEGYPQVKRRIFLHAPEASTDWVVLKNDRLILKVAANGRGARVYRNGSPVAFMSPLLQKDPLARHTKTIPLEVAKRDEKIVLTGEQDVSLTFRLDGSELHYSVKAPKPIGGPAVRVLGHLEQGLFAGLEYLGEGERSSSKLDIRTPERIRFAPDPREVTMPLMAFVTSGASVAITWERMPMQPIFATPNFLDGTSDHRMSLKSSEIDATIRVGAGWKEGGRLVDSILWALEKQGLPKPPAMPRSLEEQWNLCLEAYRGPLRTENGWGHCAEDRFGRQFYSDHASAIWRLTGEMPVVPKLVPGGAHVENPASFLVSGRADQWLDHIRNAAHQARRQQQAGGSFRYDGEYREGHFENTASGYCARRAWTLLKHAWYTGDEPSLKAGLKSLDYMKRFRTPRGAQTWEVPLHTPDILASAYLVKSYVLGFRLTENPEYLKLARRWALTGIPFVYQWADRPIMVYSTIAVYGATNWTAPNWIGRPVQWCGTVYADALLQLNRFDSTLDWQRIARGITVAAEQMQYRKGDPFVGCLPDSILLKSQQRQPWNINPGALVSLRLQLQGRLDDLDVAAFQGHRLVAPFPMEVRHDRVVIQPTTKTDYEIVVDGERVIRKPAAGPHWVEHGQLP